jgi:peptidyl-prolyl cis-trans isomerase A (cyclophilin A)
MAPRNKALRKHRPIPQKKTKKRKSNRTMYIVLGVVAVIVIVLGTLIATGALNQQPAQPLAPTKVLLQTTAGNITIDLRTDKIITSSNFINLVKESKYDSSTFHRTVADFMIQGGKVSGSVATIKDEIGTNNHNVAYSVAMAKTSHANSATSEFFINVVDNSDLDSTYTVFGNVIAGKEVVDAIAIAPATENPYIVGEISIPVNPVTILHATIVP